VFQGTELRRGICYRYRFRGNDKRGN